MAILIEPPQQQINWNTLQNKPVDLTDNKISWDEVADKPATFTPASHTQDWSTITGKPTTFTPTPYSLVEFAEGSVNYLDFHVRGVGKLSTDFDARIAAFLEGTPPHGNSYATVQYQAFKHFFYGSFFLFTLPISSTNLPAGQIWRDGEVLKVKL